MKGIIGLLVLVIAGYLAFAFMPPYFSKFQFNDDITSLARFAGPTTKSEDDIRAEVMRKAKENDIPIKEEQIQVTREQQNVTIHAHYTYVVTLIGGKQVPLEFDLRSDK